MSNIKSLKLASGEELVVEVLDSIPEVVKFKNPVAIVLQRTEQGPAIGFMPWMQSAEGPFEISQQNVMVVAETAEEVKNGYNRIFGAGIVVPSKQLITG